MQGTTAQSLEQRQLNLRLLARLRSAGDAFGALMRTREPPVFKRKRISEVGGVALRDTATPDGKAGRGSEPRPILHLRRLRNREYLLRGWRHDPARRHLVKPIGPAVRQECGPALRTSS